jgi:hypothetical protein
MRMLTWHTAKEVLRRWVHLYLQIRMVGQHPQSTHPCISNNQPKPQCPIYQQLTKDLILKFTCTFKNKTPPLFEHPKIYDHVTNLVEEVQAQFIWANPINLSYSLT